VIRFLVNLEEDAYQCGTAIFPGSLDMAFITWGSKDTIYRGDTKENIKEC
jgi:hypothetical protein